MNVGAPGLGGAIGPGMVDRMLTPEREKIDAAQGRRDRVVAEKNDYSALDGLLGDLDAVTREMSSVSQFTKLKMESSHPDILEGIATGAAMPGSYEFEVRSLAAQDRLLELGFQDRDQTPVGFGHLAIEVGGVSQDITIAPGSTLDDVVRQINESKASVKAQIVNTGFADDPIRLLVSSVETGEAAKISLDEDTTFLAFKNIKQAANLDARFEDVAVTSQENDLNELLAGVSLKAKRAEPGTKIAVNIHHDMEQTTADIKAFADKYNEIMGFAGQQYAKDPVTGRLGQMAGDGNLRTVVRKLQSEVASAKPEGGKFRSLAEIGVTTDHKTGQLRIEEQKLKAAMATDYKAVAELFAFSENGTGVANRLHAAIRSLRDPVNGVLTTRVKGLATVISEQDRNIERQKNRLEQKKETLTRQFSQLDSRLSAMQSQNQVLDARFGNGQEGQG